MAISDEVLAEAVVELGRRGLVVLSQAELARPLTKGERYYEMAKGVQTQTVEMMWDEGAAVLNERGEMRLAILFLPDNFTPEIHQEAERVANETWWHIRGGRIRTVAEVRKVGVPRGCSWQLMGTDGRLD